MNEHVNKNDHIPSAPVVKMTYGEWSGRWPMLIAAMVCCCYSVFPVNVLGPLIIPLEEQFRWSRAAISSVVLLTAVGTICVGPLIGRIADRIGPRRVALVALPALSVSIALIGMSGPTLWSWYASWGIFAAVQACAGSIIWAQAVIGRFDKDRGMALAIVLCGSALGHGLLPGFALFVMSVWNWRAVYFILAIATLAIGWPLAWRYFHGGHEGAQDEAEARDPAAGQEDASPDMVSQAPNALRTLRFWQMACAFFVVASSVSALYVHFVPILIHAGISNGDAAKVAVILGPAAIAGRLGGGYFLDRLPPNRVVAVALSLPALAYAILLFAGHSLMAVGACALLLGLVVGAEADFMAYLVSRYFGRQAFGSLYGLLLGIFAVGYGVGPFLIGAVYDSTKSYDGSFVAFAGASLLGAALIAKLGAPRRSRPRKFA